MNSGLLQRIFFIILFAGLAGVPARAQYWQPVGKPGFSASGNRVSVYQRLLINRNNELFLAYADEGFGLTSGNGTVMKFDGTDWNPVGNPGFTAGMAKPNAFAFGGGDTLYYAYANGTSTNMSRAAVMMYDGSTWSEIGVDLTTGAAQTLGLAVTGNGTVYLACLDNAAGGIIVRKYDGNNTWSQVGPAPVAIANVGSSGRNSFAMAVNSMDSLFIAYSNVISGMIAVRKFDGTNWVQVGTDFLGYPTGMGAPPTDVYLAINSSDMPYVSYSGGYGMGPGSGAPRVSVQRFDAGQWRLVGDSLFGGFYANAPSQQSHMAFDGTGAPLITFHDYSLQQKLSVLKFDGSGWVYVGPPTISADVAADPCLAVDGNGNIYVAFFDEDNDAQNTVLRYTVCQEAEISAFQATPDEVCIGDSVKLSVGGRLNEAAGWEWYAGTCNDGTHIGSGTEVWVNPTETTTYYVKGLGNCVVTAGCNGAVVNVTTSRDLGVMIVPDGNVLGTSVSYSTYQWLKDGQPVEGATAASYEVTENDDYSVAVTNVSGCMDTSDVYIVNNLSVQEAGAYGDLSIYPNPAEDRIYVRSSAALKMQLLGMDGKVLLEEPHSKMLDIRHLANGIYFLRLTDADGRLVRSEKVIKK